MRLANQLVVRFPAPRSLTYLWSIGSLAAMVLVYQVVTGILLLLYFVPSTRLAFDRADYLSREVWNGWLLRGLHM